MEQRWKIGGKEIEKLPQGDIYEYITRYRLASSGGQSNSSCRPQYQQVI